MTKLNGWKVSAISVLYGALSLSLASAQTYTVLYSFDGIHGQSPSYPNNLIQGIDGNMYGTTGGGGNKGHGVLFKTSSGGTLSVIYDFDVTHGSEPTGLSLGSAGYLYGTTVGGGVYGEGTIFRLSPSGQPTILHDFQGCSDGGWPYAPPVEAASGIFYGATWGYCQFEFLGSTYKFNKSGDFTSFGLMDDVEYNEDAPFIQGPEGDLYSTTYYGGKYYEGSVFKMTPSGEISTFYSFCQQYVGVEKLGDGKAPWLRR